MDDELWRSTRCANHTVFVWGVTAYDINHTQTGRGYRCVGTAARAWPRGGPRAGAVVGRVRRPEQPAELDLVLDVQHSCCVVDDVHLGHGFVDGHCRRA